MLDQDFFVAPEEEPNGDFIRTGRYNRPLVRAGMYSGSRWVTDADAGLVTMTRASTLSDKLSRGDGLMFWKTQHVALAVARASLGVQQSIAGMEYKDAGLRKFIDAAWQQARFSEAADLGTAIGRWGDPDAPRQYMSEELRPEVEARDEALKAHGMTILDTQVKIVNDWIMSAGSTDGLIQLPSPYVVTLPTGEYDLSGKVVIYDDKSGKDDHPVEWAIQTAIYANGARYDEVTEERSPLHPDLDTRVALIIRPKIGTGTCKIKVIDLTIGWQAAQLAALVHSQGSKGQMLMAEAPAWEAQDEVAEKFNEGGIVEDPILARIRKAASVGQLREVWNAFDGVDQTKYRDVVQALYREMSK